MNPEVVRYIREHRDMYTREAIVRKLVSAGYSPAEINAAWDALGSGEIPPIIAGGSDDHEGPTPPGLKSSVIGYVLTIYGVAFLGGLVLGNMARSFEGGNWGIITVVYSLALLAGALISIVLVRRSSSFGLGHVAGALIAVLLPFVILVIISGLCLTQADRYA